MSAKSCCSLSPMQQIFERFGWNFGPRSSASFERGFLMEFGVERRRQSYHGRQAEAKS